MAFLGSLPKITAPPSVETSEAEAEPSVEMPEAEAESSPPPPKAAASSPPPPKASSPPPPASASPPPPASASPPPPASASPPPPASASPPPPSESEVSSPPPPAAKSESPPSPPPPTSSPPPPQKSDGGGGEPPPSPSQTPPSPSKQDSSPSKDGGSSSSSSSSSPSFSTPPPSKSGSNNSSGNSGALPDSKQDSDSKHDSKSSPSDGGGGPPSDSGGGSQALVIGTVVGVVLFIALLGACALFCLCKKKKKKNRYNGSAPQSWQNQGGEHNIKMPPPPLGGGGWQQHGPPAPMSSDMTSSTYSGPHGPVLPPPSPNIALGFNKSAFTYEEVAAATGGFSQSNLLGQGGFGYVYKGILPNGKEVAVKQLKAGSGQGEREFQAEVDIISRVHHRHLVTLAGYCIAESQRILLYEFVPNNTLEYHLHGKGLPTMDFPTRLKIAIGSAKGLAYLHEDCHPRIIHRDIKTANILLDYKFEAMVADFGLAKLSSDTNTHVSTRIMGTFGYLAPEYASSGKLTDKSDVFSYGVMLLELITGKRPVDRTNRNEDSLVDWARPMLGQILAEGNYEEIVDPKLEGNYNKGEMARMISCAAASVRHSARRRPKMSQIVRALEGDAISFDDLNDFTRTGQSSQFSSGSEYDSGTYSSQMRQFQKVALASGQFTGEYSGVTSEYGLNPSDSSSSSGEVHFGAGRRPNEEV